MEERMKKKLATDVQMAGQHYQSQAIQPIQYITANNLSFCLGNVVKYVTRNKTDKVEDLLKAKHYIDLELELIHKCDSDGKPI